MATTHNSRGVSHGLDYNLPQVKISSTLKTTVSTVYRTLERTNLSADLCLGCSTEYLISEKKRVERISAAEVDEVGWPLKSLSIHYRNHVVSWWESHLLDAQVISMAEMRMRLEASSSCSRVYFDILEEEEDRWEEGRGWTNTTA